MTAEKELNNYTQRLVCPLCARHFEMHRNSQKAINHAKEHFVEKIDYINIT
jgi:hypothetical protein